MAQNRTNGPNTKFEKLPFAGKYSMKNIPLPTQKEYMKKLKIMLANHVVKNLSLKLK